jgi:hypothetical protein
MNELVARQRGVTTDDDPFGWLTSLFGDGETTTTTARTTTTRGATTTTPLLPTVPINSLITTRTTSTTPRTTSTTSISTAQVVTTPPPVVATSSRQTTTITSTASGDTSQANADAGSNTSSGGLPSVVIGIIVAASVIFGLIFIALIARKIFQSRRRNRRNTWAHNSIIAPYAPPVTEKALPPPPPVENNPYPSYPAYPPAAVAAPMASYANNPIMNQPYSPAAPSSAGYPAPYPFGGNSALGPQNTYQGASTTAGAFNAADLAGPVVIQHTPPTPTVPVSIVKRTFVPSLPDELSISNGDQVRILSAYDDGWALCEKVSTGEKGVVPQECLEASQPTGSDESRLNRNSSLRRQQDQTN